MAPPPEYDKEPKAPDKSATNIPSEDSKALYNLVNEHQSNSDSKSTNSSANAEVENNKHVETLDDGQLRALLDEAITYKCPKDREGKSSLFKELLEEVEQDEQDEQACEAAARLGGGRARRGGGRGRRALPHSNSLQDLVAALAAEPAPRRARHSHHPPASVSARAIHGGSLPSGVDTSFLLSEEPMRSAVGPSTVGAEYVATVRCVNPSPLAERRVSASDAHCPDTDALNRRSKPVFPMYTARATLEIGSGSVCSGRAVTTTTASNQVRTLPHPAQGKRPRGPERRPQRNANAQGQGDAKRGLSGQGAMDRERNTQGLEPRDFRGLRELGPRENLRGQEPNSRERGSRGQTIDTERKLQSQELRDFREMSLRGHGWDPRERNLRAQEYRDSRDRNSRGQEFLDARDRNFWNDSACVDKWYRGLEAYNTPLDQISGAGLNKDFYENEYDNYYQNSPHYSPVKSNTIINSSRLNLVNKNDKYIPVVSEDAYEATDYSYMDIYHDKPKMLDVKDVEEAMARQAYRERVGKDLVAPSKVSCNPKNVRSMSIGPSLPINIDKNNQNPGTSDARDKDKDKYNRNTRNRNERNANVNTVTDKLSSSKSADNSKPDNSKMCHREVGKTRSPSPNATSNQNKVEDNSSEADYKEISQKAKTTAEKLTDLDITEEQSPTDIELTEKAKEENNPITEDEKISETETKQLYEKSFFAFVQEVAAEDKQNYDKSEREDNTNFVEMVTMKEEPSNTANIESELKDDSNLVEMVALPSSIEPENSNDFSLFIANQQRLLRAIESNNYHKYEHTNKTPPSEIETENTDITDRPVDQQMSNVEQQTINPFLLTVKRALHPVSDTDCFDDKDSETSGTEMVDMRRAVRTDYAQADLPVNASYFLMLYKRLLTSPSNIDNVDIKPSETKPPLVALDTAAKPPKKKKDKITARLSRKPHNENSNKKKDIIRNALKKLFFDNITQSDQKLSSKTTKEVDSAIPFSCITSPEVVAGCTTTASAQAAVAVDPKPLQLSSSYRAVASLTGACELRPAPRLAQHLARPKPARSMVASTFNGVPLPRAGTHFTAAAVAQELDYKKSLDENGNSVQGFSSPQSGSSQQKKQRRKKSSKNETVIKSHHIDGYQGNKDLNEVLRFIESNEPERPKRHDDKKKRSAERRKDKAPRASSLDDLTRAAPPPARPARPAQPAPKPERRSWGDERQPFYFRDPNPEPDPELTDFQTVTKKRKPRRRADEPSPRPPRRAPSPRSPPSPRARSDRSNDSNDDVDSVHSLPALPCRPAPPASYADIARTKHNIPDLIESCNYYGEGAPEQTPAQEPTPAPGDADGYPALDPRPRRAKAPPLSRPRKERDEPAPDVVADRPAVILLDSAARPRDMDGVTFGFDIDERLLGGRLDLLQAGVPVRAGAAALRYVQPAPPADCAPLHTIVDYVAAAWEDVVRCGSGKVRYFSE